MQNNDQKGSLHETFSNFGAAPSAGLWNNISGALDKKKKRRAAIWWWSSGLAATLILGFFSWQFIAHSNMESTQKTEISNIQNVPKKQQVMYADTLDWRFNGILKTNQKEQIGKTENNVGWDCLSYSPFEFNFPKTVEMNLGFYSIPSTSNTFSLLGDSTFMVRAKDAYSIVAVQPKVTNDSSQVLSENLPQMDSTELFNEPTETDFVVALRIVPKKWQVGLSVGFTSVLDNSSLLIHSQPISDPLTDGIIGTQKGWNLDASIARMISRNTWLETGLHFGILNGTFTSFDNSSIKNVRYHVLGIPLQIGYEFHLSGRFYTTPYFGLQYDLAERITDQYIIGEVSSASLDSYNGQQTNVVRDQVQFFSTQFGVELAYKFRRNWNIVLRPSMQAYVYGKTSKETSNEFKKIWMNGSIGITKRF